ncbi:MAG: bifunctional phosphoglucose/phosphomannose isomerase [Bacteroidetes bacterium]|nr:bifunctional phosphoglucose/phosphomannose isomerase [Bacteroidota bacterium]
MKNLVEQFPAQIEAAIAIGKHLKISETKEPVGNVLICGLGGSGIGGTIISELAFSHAGVPVNATKGYSIPSYINRDSLVIISSYSGNTEETLACMHAALNKGATIFCITSGGKVEQLAKEKKLDHVIIPAGMPPRACLSYSLVQLIFLFINYKLLPENSVADLENSVVLLKKEENSIKQIAKKLAADLHGKTPVIYCTTYYEGVAIRFRQQLNENAKVLCWHHVIPEMNHNELVGWAGGNENIAVVLFRDPTEFERNNHRIELNKEIISKRTPHFTEIFSKGNSQIEKTLYLIHLGDWASVFLAQLRGVDDMEVNVINFLKGELSKK